MIRILHIAMLEKHLGEEATVTFNAFGVIINTVGKIRKNEDCYFIVANLPNGTYTCRIKEDADLLYNVQVYIKNKER